MFGNVGCTNLQNLNIPSSCVCDTAVTLEHLFEKIISSYVLKFWIGPQITAVQAINQRKQKSFYIFTVNHSDDSFSLPSISVEGRNACEYCDVT